MRRIDIFNLKKHRIDIFTEAVKSSSKGKQSTNIVISMDDKVVREKNLNDLTVSEKHAISQALATKADTFIDSVLYDKLHNTIDTSINGILSKKFAELKRSSPQLVSALSNIKQDIENSIKADASKLKNLSKIITGIDSFFELINPANKQVIKFEDFINSTFVTKLTVEDGTPFVAFSLQSYVKFVISKVNSIIKDPTIHQVIDDLILTIIRHDNNFALDGNNAAGKSEVPFTLFSNLKKADHGDLETLDGSMQIEMKGQGAVLNANGISTARARMIQQYLDWREVNAVYSKARKTVTKLAADSDVSLPKGAFICKLSQPYNNVKHILVNYPAIEAANHTRTDLYMVDAVIHAIALLQSVETKAERKSLRKTAGKQVITNLLLAAYHTLSSVSIKTIKENSISKYITAPNKQSLFIENPTELINAIFDVAEVLEHKLDVLATAKTADELYGTANAYIKDISTVLFERMVIFCWAEVLHTYSNTHKFSHACFFNLDNDDKAYSFLLMKTGGETTIENIFYNGMYASSHKLLASVVPGTTTQSSAYATRISQKLHYLTGSLVKQPTKAELNKIAMAERKAQREADAAAKAAKKAADDAKKAADKQAKDAAKAADTATKASKKKPKLVTESMNTNTLLEILKDYLKEDVIDDCEPTDFAELPDDAYEGVDLGADYIITDEGAKFVIYETVRNHKTRLGDKLGEVTNSDDIGELLSKYAPEYSKE